MSLVPSVVAVTYPIGISLDPCEVPGMFVFVTSVGRFRSESPALGGVIVLVLLLQWSNTANWIS